MLTKLWGGGGGGQNRSEKVFKFIDINHFDINVGDISQILIIDGNNLRLNRVKDRPNYADKKELGSFSLQPPLQPAFYR